MHVPANLLGAMPSGTRMHPLIPVPAQALFLAGLRLEEVAVTREIMDALGASEVKVLLL